MGVVSREHKIIMKIPGSILLLAFIVAMAVPLEASTTGLAREKRAGGYWGCLTSSSTGLPQFRDDNCLYSCQTDGSCQIRSTKGAPGRGTCTRGGSCSGVPRGCQANNCQRANCRFNNSSNSNIVIHAL